MSLEGKGNNEALADELLALQEKENEGRGVSCIRGITDSMRSGDIDGARAWAMTDDDKIRAYPEIRQWLEDNLFGPDVDSPLKMLK